MRPRRTSSQFEPVKVNTEPKKSVDAPSHVKSTHKFGQKSRSAQKDRILQVSLSRAFGGPGTHSPTCCKHSPRWCKTAQRADNVRKFAEVRDRRKKQPRHYRGASSRGGACYLALWLRDECSTFCLAILVVWEDGFDDFGGLGGWF